MLHRRKWITVIAIAFGLVMFSPVAQAEQPFDLTDNFEIL